MEIPKLNLPKPKPKKQKKITCSTCNVVTQYSIEEETVEEIIFLTMQMEVCKHKFAIGAWDKKAKEKKDLTRKISKRMTALIIAGDNSGAIRTTKKYQAAQIAHAKAMIRTWKEYGHLIDATASEALLGNEESSGFRPDTKN